MSYIDVLNDAAARADAASTKAEGASQLLEDIANGPVETYVPTLNGPVPTAATAIGDIRDEVRSGVFSNVVEEIVLSAGQTNVTFNNIQTLGMMVYINEGAEGAFRYFDFTATGTDSIVLGSGFSAGTVLYGISPTNLDGSLSDAVHSSEQSAQNAAQSESNALGYSNTAQAAATDALVARDAAFVNADVYDDVAAGIAGTSDGEQFQVVEGAEVVRYRYESGSAVEVARYPTPAGVIGTRRVAPGNGFPDPDFNNLSAWSGAPVERREVNGRAPQKHYIIAEENSADFDLYSPTWPVIHGQEYRYFTRYGNIFSGGSGEPINVTIHVEYFSDPQAENLLESRELNSVVSLHAEDRLAYDVAPIGSSCARFRFEKVGSGGTNLIVSTLDVREAINATLMGGRAHEGIGSAGRVPSPTTDELASFSTSLAGGPLENRPPLLEPNIHMALTGPALQFSGAVTVARRIMVDLGPDEAQRTLRADFLFSRRGPAAGGIPIDCEIGVAWYDNEGATLGESLFVQLEQIPFTMSHHSFTFGRHAGAELKSPEGAFLAIPFIRFTTDEENAQPLVRAIDVHLEAPPLAETSGRVPVPAAHELIALTNSLAGGPMSARPSLVRSEILVGTSGPTMHLSGPGLVARRRMVYLSSERAERVSRVNFLFSRRGAAGGGIPIDCEIGVAWYDNEQQPSSVPETIVQTFEQIPFTITKASFSFSRHGVGSDVEGPEDAYFAIPFIRFTTDEEGAQPLLNTIEVYDVASPDLARSPRTPLRGYFEPSSLTNSLAGGDVENRPAVSGYDVFEGSTGPSLQFEAPVIVARRQMVDMGPPEASPPWVTKVQMGVSRAGISAGPNGVPVDVDFGIAWYKADRTPSDTPKTVVRQELQIDVWVLYHSFTFGRSGAKADVIAPEDAYFAIPYVEITSEVGLPRIAFIEAHDVTDVVYLEPDIGGDAVTGGEQTSDVITRFDLPLRISEAEAEQLSPADRALREWFYIDGALVHRDDLPAFAPATPSATIDFPSGEAWTHTVDAGNSVIEINARQTNVSGINRRLFAVQVDGVQGMTPTVHVTRADDWNSPYTLTRHRLAWSPDLDGDDWKPFDLEVYDSGNNEWRFQNTYPFGFGRVFLANTPFYSWGRVLRKDMEWARNRHTRPTESSLGGYVIGTASARTAPYYSKPVPATEHTAFRVGSGDKIVALFSGVHPDEKPGYYQLEGCMNLILSETEIGQRLRETFTFYVYPAVNRQGLHAGAVRWEAETGEDANRIWGVGAITNDLRSIYETAWATDLGDKDVVAAFDFHSTAATNPATSSGAQLWYNFGQKTEAETALLEHMEGYREFDHVEMSTTTSVSAYMRSQFSPPITMTSEFTHARTDGIDDWRAWGRNLLRGLYALREQL